MHFRVQKLFDSPLLATSKSILTMDPKNPTLIDGATTMKGNLILRVFAFQGNTICGYRKLQSF